MMFPTPWNHENERFKACIDDKGFNAHFQGRSLTAIRERHGWVRDHKFRYRRNRLASR